MIKRAHLAALVLRCCMRPISMSLHRHQAAARGSHPVALQYRHLYRQHAGVNGMATGMAVLRANRDAAGKTCSTCSLVPPQAS